MHSKRHETVCIFSYPKSWVSNFERWEIVARTPAVAFRRDLLKDSVFFWDLEQTFTSKADHNLWTKGLRSGLLGGQSWAAVKLLLVPVLSEKLKLWSETRWSWMMASHHSWTWLLYPLLLSSPLSFGSQQWIRCYGHGLHSTLTTCSIFLPSFPSVQELVNKLCTYGRSSVLGHPWSVEKPSCILDFFVPAPWLSWSLLQVVRHLLNSSQLTLFLEGTVDKHIGCASLSCWLLEWSRPCSL